MQEFIRIQPFPTYIHSSFRQFYNGEKHVDRRVKEYVLLFMLKNTLYFSEDGVNTAVTEGEWYLQLPNLLQKGEKGSPAPYYYYIHFQMQESDDPNRMILPLRGKFRAAYYLPLFEKLDACSKQTGLISNYIGQQAVFLEIMESLVLTYNQPLTKKQILVKSVMQYLSDHYAEDINALDMQDLFHYAPDYLSHIMREEKGVTYRQFLQSVRVSKAKELLTYTDLPVTEIAQNTGYHDNSVFYKAFRDSTGFSPREWRKISRGFA